MMSTKTAVVWNPRAGKAAASASLRDELQRRPGFTLLEAASRAEVAECVRTALDTGAERIYLAGGDGTVSTAADTLMRSSHRVPLGVLPIGTGNDFCRTLGVPLSPHEALDCLDAALLRLIDVVRMEDGNHTHYFVNMAAAGTSDHVLDHATHEQKQWWGPLAYLLGALDAARNLETYRVKVEDESGELETFEAWNLMLAGGRSSGGGIPVAPRARPDDGLIDLVVVRSGNLPEILRAGAHLLMNKLLQSDLVEYRQASGFTIEAQPTMRFTADGDVIEWVPVRFHCCPGAIPMHVGPEFDASVVERRGE